MKKPVNRTMYYLAVVLNAFAVGVNIGSIQHNPDGYLNWGLLCMCSVILVSLWSYRND